MFVPPEIPSPPGREEAARERAEATQTRRATDRRHIPSLDGLRGVAVAGVLAFHAGYLPGGYLGVDLFFVLSGFLITYLLIAEERRNGRIDLVAFWGRRARRLLPALFAMMAALVVYTAVFDSSGSSQIRSDAVPSLLYYSNWHFVFTDYGYWGLFSDLSPLGHTWSLSVEEQFYLIWPILVIAAFAVLPRRPAAVLVLSLLGAAASIAAMIALFDPSAGYERVYFGTDTRVSSMLIGSALASVIDPGRQSGLLRLATFASPPEQGAGSSRQLLELAGTASALLLVVTWFSVSQDDPLLYRGLLPLTALATAVLIASVVHPVRGVLFSVFSFAPFRWLGTISYGLYLWHWPVFLVVDSEVVDLDGWRLAALRVAVSVGISVASFHLVEIPFRDRQLPLTSRSAEPVVQGALGGLLGVAATIVMLLAVLLVPASETGPLSVESADARSDALTVLVVGDSLAGDFAAGLAAVNTDGRMDIRDLHQQACGLFPTTASMVSGERVVPTDPTCLERPSAWSGELAESNPDVVLLSSSRWDGTLKDVDGAWTHPCEATYHETYDPAVAAAVDQLSGGTRRVIVVTAMDDRGVEGETWTDCVNDVYRRLASEHPLVQLLDIDDVLCEYNKCIDTVNGLDLMRDEFHFSLEGATYVASTFVEPALRSALGPPESLALRGGEGRPSVVLLGDSIFGELGPGLEVAMENFEIIDETIQFCGLVDVAASRVGEDQLIEPDDGCKNARNRWRAVVADAEPELVLVSASRWDATWKVLDDGAIISPCSQLMRDRAEQFVDATASIFAAGRTRVVLVTLPDVRSGESETFTDCANDVYRSIAASNPDVDLFDVDRLLCPNHVCSASLDGEIDAVDGYHFTEEGVEQIGRWIFGAYEALPRRD